MVVARFFSLTLLIAIIRENMWWVRNRLIDLVRFVCIRLHDIRGLIFRLSRFQGYISTGFGFFLIFLKLWMFLTLPAVYQCLPLRVTSLAVHFHSFSNDCFAYFAGLPGGKLIEGWDREFAGRIIPYWFSGLIRDPDVYSTPVVDVLFQISK